METTEDTPHCTLKCLRNIEDVTHRVHLLKYGVNTIGRGLNNNIVIKNLNVSRTHCHLRVEKKESKDIAYIQDLGTSNGTIVGNINLKEFEEHQLNDLDMIVLASGDEGVVLQFIDQIDRTISNVSNISNNKRKVLSVENLDAPPAVKIPKIVLNDTIKELISSESTNVSSKSMNSVYNNMQHPSTFLSSLIPESIKDSDCPILPAKNVSLHNTRPSCSHHEDNVLTSVIIKTEPNTMNYQSSQGIYRDEGDSVIVIYSSDEENDNKIENNLGLLNIKTEPQEFTNMVYPSTSKVDDIPNIPEWPIQCQRNDEMVSDDEEDMMKSNYHINNAALNSSDSDDGYERKCLKMIEPLPMKTNNNTKRGQTKVLAENKNIIKTRAKSEKKIMNKKKTEEMTVDQNKQIILERRMRLKQLANNNHKLSSTEKKISNDNVPTYDEYIDNPSTTDKLKIKTRISKLQQNNNLTCMPSTSKTTSKINAQVVQRSSFDCNKMSTLSTNTNDSFNFAYFDTLSRICKWNAVWLREEKCVDQSPPLVKSVNKMKGHFENLTEYLSTVKSLMFYEIWSKLSESYNLILSKNPNLEKCIFEKSLKKDVPLFSFDVQSVNKEYSKSIRALKSISEPLWCLKCIETNNKNLQTSSGLRFPLKGYLCIIIIQSNCFETNTSGVKKPTKSRNIFFGFIHVLKKFGHHSNSQLYIELLVTKKTDNIPSGTLIQLMDIFYLHSELRLFQAIYNVTKSSLSNALITPQSHNYNIDYSKANLKGFNLNSLILNNSQKEAVKMAVTICSLKEPNLGLIIGPPGTGKTNVICNIVLTLISKLQLKNNTKPKFLLCAPSNDAVDALVRRIIEIKKKLKCELQFNVVRVGGGQKYDPLSPIADVMLDTLVKQRMNNPEQCQSNMLSIFTNKKDLEKDILQNSDVVVTTLNSCYSKSMEDAFMPSTNLSAGCHFTACIVDEAGQCVEPLNFVPILLGVEKLILVGDDKQLQPLVKSKLAKDNGFGISLFKRLKTWFEHKHYTRRNFPIRMLDTQYRMHPEICSFPSEYFYKGKVKTAPLVNSRKQLSFQPYVILEHESKQDNSGEINIGEANMIVCLVEVLMNSECKPLTIAVLTPYHKQREQINTLLEKKRIALNVNTIDSFQGGECDILLISTVRTNGVGFMDDICRLNVALTRARQSLIICGNFMSLKGERVWCDLLENAKKRKLIKKVSNKCITDSKVLNALIKYS